MLHNLPLLFWAQIKLDFAWNEMSTNVKKGHTGPIGSDFLPEMHNNNHVADTILYLMNP